MGSQENLIRNSDLTPQERKAKASKAGKASGAARAKKRDMRKMLLALLESDAGGAEMQEAMYEMDTDGSVMAAVLCGQLKAAARGNSQAMAQIIALAGADTLTRQDRREQKARIARLEADVARESQAKEPVEIVLDAGLEDYTV